MRICNNWTRVNLHRIFFFSFRKFCIFIERKQIYLSFHEENDFHFQVMKNDQQKWELWPNLMKCSFQPRPPQFQAQSSMWAASKEVSSCAWMVTISRVIARRTEPPTGVASSLSRCGEFWQLPPASEWIWLQFSSISRRCKARVRTKSDGRKLEIVERRHNHGILKERRKKGTLKKIQGKNKRPESSP